MQLNRLIVHIDGQRVSLRELSKANIFVHVFGKRLSALGRETVVSVPLTGATEWTFRPFECVLAEFVAVIQCSPQWEHIAKRVCVTICGTADLEYIEIAVPTELTIYQSDRRAQS